MSRSDAYVQHLLAGPFSGQVDPWAEDDHYFQRIHSGMIADLVDQIQIPLIKMGYRVGQEASLQIAEGREPDIFIEHAMNVTRASRKWDYALAAEEVLADPGDVLTQEITLDAIHIYYEHELVTVVEIISPGNKAKPSVIADYRRRRERLILDQGVNVVEIDATRSIKRLVVDPTANQSAYHVAIYIPGQHPRLVEMQFGQPLKVIALPLRENVIRVELQAAYTTAYQKTSIAQHLNDKDSYTEDNLPFASLLTDNQRGECLKRVAQWQDRLRQLDQTNGL